MNKSFYYPWVGILCLALLLSSCKQTGKSAGQKDEGSALTAEGFVMIPRHFENKLTVTANLLPEESVELKSPVSGTILAIHFNEGQHVKKGESLLQIDDRVWKAQVKGLKAQLIAARKELKRKQDLLLAEGASQEEVETARSEVEQLEAQIEELSVYISLASVPAPFSGKIGMRDLSVGAYLSQGQTIIQIVRSEQLKIDFSLPGRYISQVKAGQNITVASNGDTLMAPVYAINPVVDENARTLQVRARLENKKDWFPGNFAEVIMILDVHDSAMVVPSQLIVPELGAETVYIYKNGKAIKQTITTGPRNETDVLVTSGLTPGDTLLASGLMQVREGMSLKINKTVSESEL